MKRMEKTLTLNDVDEQLKRLRADYVGMLRDSHKLRKLVSEFDLKNYPIVDSTDATITELTEARYQLASRIRNYLGAGGLINPEMMEHDKVRDLLQDCLYFLDIKQLDPMSGVAVQMKQP